MAAHTFVSHSHTPFYCHCIQWLDWHSWFDNRNSMWP